MPDVREKLVEMLWEYDQLRMMRMSIEECADRLITKGLSVRKCENDTKCFDSSDCLAEKGKQTLERIVDLMTEFYGVEPGYYGVEAHPLASHLIANGVTIQRWIPVTERLPRGYGGELSENVIVRTINGEITTGWVNANAWWLLIGENDYHTRHGHDYVTHWMPLPEAPKEDE